METFALERPHRRPILTGLLFLFVLVGIVLLYARSTNEATEMQLVDVELVSG